MQHFELSLNEEINVYINSGMTPTELFILRLLFLAADGDQRYLINYISNISDGKKILRQVLESLKVKKVINSTFNIPKEGEALNFKNIPFNKVTLKTYIRESNELGKEFFDNYPMFVSINGKMCSLRNFTKGNFQSLEQFCIHYSAQIKNCGVTHERIMAAVTFGRENNLIHYTILEFIASQKWIELEHIKNSDNINGYNNMELL